MNLNSKYFDRIRIRRDEAPSVAADARPCEWHGCGRLGGYRAPKGRGHEGQYYNLCLEHVRDYNRSYNYFAGMKDDDIVAYQRAAQTGHRPTWTMGVNSEGEGRVKADGAWSAAFSDPFGIFGGGGAGAQYRSAQPERRPLKNVERRSFATLDLEGGETGDEIKTRYKTLVKQLHPDANGGDRSSEDRLRQIIQAYHYLKAAGFC
jgi:hypothetical protein